MFADLDDLAARFVACRLSREEWTHHMHLAVGMWHIHRYGAVEALARLRTGIRRLNDSHGTPNSTTRGYHETITRAYVQLLSEFLETSPAEASLEERVAHLIASPIADRDFLLRFYSRERLMSPEARADWLEPNIMALRVGDALGGETENRILA